MELKVLESFRREALRQRAGGRVRAGVRHAAVKQMVGRGMSPDKALAQEVALFRRSNNEHARYLVDAASYITRFTETSDGSVRSQVQNEPPTTADMDANMAKLRNMMARHVTMFADDARTDRRCGSCGNDTFTVEQKQTRSADEPMSEWSTCRKCGKRERLQ